MSFRPTRFTVCQHQLPGHLLLITAKGSSNTPSTIEAKFLEEVIGHEQTEKSICDALLLADTDFICIVPCGAGAAQSMCECLLAKLYERGEGLSRRSGVPGRRTCRSSGLCPRLPPHAAAVTLTVVHRRWPRTAWR